MKARNLYHITNGIALIVLVGYSLNLILNWAELLSVNLLYIILPVIGLNYGLRIWAKKMDTELINPIVETSLVRALYYGGAIMFIAAIVVHFMSFYVLETPLLILAMVVETVAWVLSLIINRGVRHVSSDIIDDLEL